MSELELPYSCTDETKLLYYCSSIQHITKCIGTRNSTGLLLSWSRGLHMILFGDFFELPPVSDQYVFNAPISDFS